MSFYNPHNISYGQHFCGLYYNFTEQGRLLKTYLPQVELQAHATILSTTSRTVLKQTFINPSTERGIREVRYTFPLYDGVSVVGFKCHVGDRLIIGEVKEKEKARAVFKDAIAKGQTAGLLEQLPEASDVFTTTVGNIPPSAKVIIEITYLGELKHDMEVDGIRFTIPNIICPRYGSVSGQYRSLSAPAAVSSSISITVDAEMEEGTFIQKIQSPTHPISMTMGTTSVAPNSDPSMTKASATLTLGKAELENDFVLQVVTKNTGVPRAILEKHPTLPNHRALMTTLVPKFSLPPEKPELVFVCDRSGSMGGTRITLVIEALKVFLKSLPVGVKFNICSFGSSYSFLWPKSVTYSQQTLDEAIQHAQAFMADYGGTEMLMPLKATIEQRYKDIPLDVMLLTDGEIWDQQALFNYLNQAVTESKAPIRLFTLGIGNGVSHALIEGVAKAGNGFSQTVGEGEKMDTKVVRMLKGALSPHVHDYTLEVKYNKSDTAVEGDDDFELVEKVADSLKVKLDLGKEEEKSDNPKPISLFDTSVDPDAEKPPAYDETGEQRYAHLPSIMTPKIIQAPQNIPSLFAFNRTTAYLLLGPDAPAATPKSVILRGTSAHGPLELEIPIQVLDMPGETIHQLAAKKAISELEQGRGWLPEAKDEAGTLIKTRFEGRFDDMVEREAVKLGVQFQVGGKWCSFVAVESNKQSKEVEEKKTEGWDWLEDETQAEAAKYSYAESSEYNEGLMPRQAVPPRMRSGSPFGNLFGLGKPKISRKTSRAVPSQGFEMSLGQQQAPVHAQASNAQALQAHQSSLMMLKQENKNRRLMMPAGSSPSFNSAPPLNNDAFPAPPGAPPPMACQSFGSPAKVSSDQSTMAYQSSGPPPQQSFGSTSLSQPSADTTKQGPAAYGLNPIAKKAKSSSITSGISSRFSRGSMKPAPYDSSASMTSPPPPPPPAKTPQTPEALTNYLILLQTFEGFWTLSPSLLESLKVQDAAVQAERAKSGVDVAVFVTALVIAMFEQKLKAFEGTWELVVEKAKGWLGEQGVGDVEGLVAKAGVLVK
ncbi:von Willebrand factor type A domain-containing protein [Phaeosphaeriaceae sp. PMI808]|nr:von Willebrand factor type A domain-containing protein [Phaeosphaeriaceae sp. PMI808]